jgi:multidrug efflux pump subunit AcrA (membrane-fusion protein)
MMTVAHVWAYAKKYWQLILLVVGGVVGIFLLRSKENSFTDDYKKIQDNHAKEIAAINAANAEQTAKLEANQQKLQAALDAVQKQYDAQNKALDDKKKAEITQIVKDYGHDPDALARQLSSATGFSIVMPPS